MLYYGNVALVAADMVIFIHIILYNNEQGPARTSGQSVIVGEPGADVEPVT